MQKLARKYFTTEYFNDNMNQSFDTRTSPTPTPTQKKERKVCFISKQTNYPYQPSKEM